MSKDEKREFFIERGKELIMSKLVGILRDFWNLSMGAVWVFAEVILTPRRERKEAIEIHLRLNRPPSLGIFKVIDDAVNKYEEDLQSIEGYNHVTPLWCYEEGYVKIRLSSKL